MPWKKFLVTYDHYLHSQPILTKSLTSGILFGFGDFIAQHIEWYRFKRLDSPKYTHDYKRTFRMMIWGGALFAPIGHMWYNFLESRVTISGKFAVIAKIAADQLVFTPPVTVAFFTSVSIMSGDKSDVAIKDATSKLWPTLKVNWTVWPIIHCVTFGVIPLQYRILFINFMSLGWSAFLSSMSASVIDTDKEKV